MAHQLHHMRGMELDQKVDEQAPIRGYDVLNARQAMHAILDLPKETLQRLHTWEERHRRRAQVLAAIRRTIDRRRASEPQHG